MLTTLELSYAKRICKSSNPSTFQIRYFTYVLYPKWLGGRYERYEYDDDKVLTHFKAAKQDFLSAQPKELKKQCDHVYDPIQRICIKCKEHIYDIL